MKQKFLCTMLAVLFVAVFFSLCHGYDDKLTHRTLSKGAANSSYVESYLYTDMLIPEGYKKQFQIGKSILDFLQDGSEKEDSPMCRASNHFLNPLNMIPWQNSFMNDEPFYIKCYCTLTGWGTKFSAVTWGTGFLAPAPDG